MFDNLFAQWGATQTAFTIGGLLVGSVACVAASASPLFSPACFARMRRERSEDRSDAERS